MLHTVGIPTKVRTICNCYFFANFGRALLLRPLYAAFPSPSLIFVVIRRRCPAGRLLSKDVPSSHSSTALRGPRPCSRPCLQPAPQRKGGHLPAEPELREARVALDVSAQQAQPPRAGRDAERQRGGAEVGVAQVRVDELDVPRGRFRHLVRRELRRAVEPWRLRDAGGGGGGGEGERSERE